MMLGMRDLKGPMESPDGKMTPPTNKISRILSIDKFLIPSNRAMSSGGLFMEKGIIAVSDVHLGYINSDKTNFEKFLDDLAAREDIKDFVICGDLLDMWRRDMAGVTIEHLNILNKLQNLKPEVHYLAGNHDYHIHHLTKYQYPFDFTKDYDPREGLQLMNGGKIYLFKHGYDFESLMSKNEYMFDILSSTSDESGNFKSWLYDVISNIEAIRRVDIGMIQNICAKIFDEGFRKAIESLSQPKSSNLSGGQVNDNPNKDVLNDLLKPIEERMKIQGNGFDRDYFIRSLKENVTLVFGHTHKPFHYEKDKTKAINLGSWITSIIVRQIIPRPIKIS